jgi:signal transduction histidine kinase
MSDAGLVVNAEGEVILTNPAYERVFGGPDPPPDVSRPDGTPLPPEESPRQRVASGESFSQELMVTSPDGNVGYFEAVGQPLHPDGADHPAEGRLIVVRDITDRSLRGLQEQFLQDASHELRTPLTVLTSYLDMLARLPVGDERAPEYARLGRAQAHRMERLMTDLLDIAQLQGGKLAMRTERIELVPLVEQTVQSILPLPGGEMLNLGAVDSRLVVEGDPTRFEQVLLNLINNAMAHAPESEHIDVRVRGADGMVEIQVQDEGPGIPEASLPHLVSRFFTAEQADRDEGGGLGLGLYITREIVTQLGGTIDAESAEAKGTTITVRLPLVEGE